MQGGEVTLSRFGFYPNCHRWANRPSCGDERRNHGTQKTAARVQGTGRRSAAGYSACHSVQTRPNTETLTARRRHNLQPGSCAKIPRLRKETRIKEEGMTHHPNRQYFLQNPSNQKLTQFLPGSIAIAGPIAIAGCSAPPGGHPYNAFFASFSENLRDQYLCQMLISSGRGRPDLSRLSCR